MVMEILCTSSLIFFFLDYNFASFSLVFMRLVRKELHALSNVCKNCASQG